MSVSEPFIRRPVGTSLLAAGVLLLGACAIAWSAAAGMYVVAVLMLKLRWPSRSAASKQRLYDILPHSRAELPPYVLLCVVAGIAEEFIYRGVMTELAQRLIGIAIITIVAGVTAGLAPLAQIRRGNLTGDHCVRKHSAPGAVV